MPEESAAFSDAIERGRRVLAPTDRLFYEEPVHMVRAEGVWMYDADGRRYLDAYNNAPVESHCHPEVVDRMCTQARILNTHTRYVTDPPVELAERLLATVPPERTSVGFTCTGSESNEVAMQVSKAAIGGAAGRYNDASKIRPPLTIQRAGVGLLLETFGRVLLQER